MMEPQEVPMDAAAMLEQYKEKTKQWKQAVKVQLEDAASKNRSLREEIKRLQSSHDEQLSQLRLELDAEFTERTQHKDASIEQLTNELVKTRELHRKEKEEIHRLRDSQQEDERQQNLGNLASAIDAVKRQYEAELQDARGDSERVTRNLENLRHELALSQAKLSQTKVQLDAAQAELLARNNDEANEQHLANERAVKSKESEGLRAQIDLHIAKQAALADQLERTVVDHKKELLLKDELREDEIQRREERIIVLQTILKQAQKESNELHLRWSTMQDDHHRIVDTHIAEHERLVDQFRIVSAQYEDLKKKHLLVEEECIRSKKTVADLEESNAIRDRSFQELLMSDDQKHMMAHLEQRLDAATNDVEHWQTLYVNLRETLDAEKRLVEDRANAATVKESELERKLSALADKQAWISTQEKRLRDQHQQLSAQAEQILNLARDASGNPGTSRQSGSSLLASDAVDGNADAVGNFYQNIRHSFAVMKQNYQTALSRSNGSKKAAASLLFRHYRNLLPVVFVVLFLVTLVYWWMFSGVSPSSAGERSLTTYNDMSEELKAMKREYGLLLGKMTQCCSTEPVPPPLPQGVFRKLS